MGGPLQFTPCRFGRVSQGCYWNTGNGSPDALCFSVDRPGVVVAGVGVYCGGAGATYECDVELLTTHDHDVRHVAVSRGLRLRLASRRVACDSTVECYC